MDLLHKFRFRRSLLLRSRRRRLGPATQSVSALSETFAELFVEFVALPADRLQKLAVAVLDNIDRGLAFAYSDDVLDVARSLLPTLHRLRHMGLGRKAVTGRIGILEVADRNAKGLDHCRLVSSGHGLGCPFVPGIERLAVSLDEVARSILGTD